MTLPVRWVSAAARAMSRPGAAGCGLGMLVMWALAPSASLAGPEFGPSPSTPAIGVSLAASDLSTPDGDRVAHERIRRAVGELCSERPDLPPTRAA